METVEMKKPWETLPSLALLNIFRNLNFKDRFGSIPLVCKEWNSIISNDPRCYSSMIPDSISPEDAFIKKPDYSDSILPYDVVFFYGAHVTRRLPGEGVSYLRNLIKKSSSDSGGGGSSTSSSTITSLCLDRFHFSIIHQDEILHLIAHCCPNLKHISFDGFYCASIEAVVQVFKRCKKIELIDFSDSVYADSIHVIEVLGQCLPNLRGIRMAGWKTKYSIESIHDAIATHLPRIKLLTLICSSNEDEDFRKLTSETECCLYELQYLSVAVYSIIKYPPPVCTHIPEFHYEANQYDWDPKCMRCKPLHPGIVSLPRLDLYLPWCDCDSCYSRFEEEEEAKAKARDKAYLDFYLEMKHLCFEEEQKAREEAYLEYYLEMEYSRFDDDEVHYWIMKQSKECEYYVSISKEKKKKTRRNHPYVVLRRKDKKEASFLSKMKMRKKRDKYDYQDYYVQPLLSYR